jgi:hypothetical protein
MPVSVALTTGYNPKTDLAVPFWTIASSYNGNP